MVYSMMQQKSNSIEEEELTELLEKVLEEALGGKIQPKESALIVDIAKQMIKEMDQPITKADIKNREEDTLKLLGNTLVAATSVAMHLTQKQSELSDMLKQHKELSNDLKLNPKQPDKQKQLDNLKIKIQKTMKEINAIDPRHPNNQEEPKPDILDKAEKVVEQAKALKAKPSQNGKDALTQALTNLYGMDPRVAGSVATPVPCIIGNEYGIPDIVGYGNDPLEILSNDDASKASFKEHHQSLVMTDYNETPNDNLHEKDNITSNDNTHDNTALEESSNNEISVTPSGKDIEHDSNYHFGEPLANAMDKAIDKSADLLHESPRPTPPT